MNFGFKHTSLFRHFGCTSGSSRLFRLLLLVKAEESNKSVMSVDPIEFNSVPVLATIHKRKLRPKSRTTPRATCSCEESRDKRPLHLRLVSPSRSTLLPKNTGQPTSCSTAATPSCHPARQQQLCSQPKRTGAVVPSRPARRLEAWNPAMLARLPRPESRGSQHGRQRQVERTQGLTPSVFRAVQQKTPLGSL